MKSVQIRSFFWSVFSCIRIRKTPYWETFHAVTYFIEQIVPTTSGNAKAVNSLNASVALI